MQKNLWENMKHLTCPVINGGSRKASLRRKLGLHETKLVLQESGGDSSEGFSSLRVCFIQVWNSVKMSFLKGVSTNVES